MAFNFLETVKGFFGNEMIGRAATYLGENEVVLRKGLDAIIPASLAGIVNRVQSGNPESILTLAKEAYSSGIVSSLSDSFRTGGEGVPKMGPSLLTNIFGDKFGALANAVSGFSGVKGSTASSLFGSIVPLALALLGKHASEDNLSPGAVASLLGSQKSSILSSLPAGFNLSKILGWSNGGVTHAHTSTPELKKNNMLWPILLGVLGILLLLWLLRTCNSRPAEPTRITADTVEQAKTETVKIEHEPVKLKLPNGVELDAYKGGIEEMLLAFINDSGATAGKDNWFDFNELNFKFGTAELIPESEKEVNNIVKILQAYPRVKIKIGGYTDKVGDEATNKKLSGDRATAVANTLKAAGVGSQVTDAEGYGSEFAKYPADAPEENRIKDRRVSVSVREK